MPIWIPMALKGMAIFLCLFAINVFRSKNRTTGKIIFTILTNVAEVAVIVVALFWKT